MAEFDRTSEFFTAFRKEYGFPNFYREQPLDWLSDVGMWGVGIVYITAVLAITVIIAFLGTRGYSRWRVTLQMIISMGIGFTIIICVTGINWQILDYETETASGDTLKYTLNIGLKQANISMARTRPPSSEYLEFHNVKIGWYEVYQAEMEYREALMRGWPQGILRIARYVSVDMGEMRYMRAFRWSGYSVWVLLWGAFAAWILANVLMGSNIMYAAGCLLFTGVLQLLACIIYSSEKPNDFTIPMDDGNITPLRLRYDWMYWLTLFMGIFVILMSVIILVLDYLRPADMNKFFGTTAEFHSPFDEAELIQNQNKDIKGLIRSLSTKKHRGDEHDKLSRKTSGSRHGAHGSDNAGFAKSMSTIEEGLADERKHSSESRSVPRIDVTNMEMADITVEHDDTPNNNATGVHKNNDPDTEVDSDIDSDKDSHGAEGSQHSTMSIESSSDRHLRPRASITSTTHSQHQLITEDN